MVFEVLVEGFVTRLAAVFQSQDPQTIGAVRSARLADRSLTPMFDGALVYSGTSAYAWKLISRDAADGKYVELSADHAGGYYRVSFRAAPYNLFTSAQNMRQQLAAIGAQGSAKVPAWGFLATTEHPATVAGMAGGTEATEVTIPYRKDSSLVTYKYDASTRTYQRFQNNDGKAVREVDALTSTPVNASTVVVIHTEIWEVDEIVDAAGSHAHDMRLLGKGAATVFRDGLRQEATWSRQHDRDPFTFASAAATPCASASRGCSATSAPRRTRSRSAAARGSASASCARDGSSSPTPSRGPGSRASSTRTSSPTPTAASTRSSRTTSSTISPTRRPSSTRRRPCSRPAATSPSRRAAA